jgi:aminobenzoyl-glutamate transport protein
MKIKSTTFLTVFLAIAELFVVLLSWVLSSTTMMNLRSLLSTEGIRWFLGHYHDIVLTPVLVWILLFSMAFGVLIDSHILKRANNYRSRVGFRIACMVLLIYIAIIALLVAIPHAILLSATGSLYPSPFSKAFFPLVAFGILMMGVSYGVVARTYVRPTDVIQALLNGIYKGAPLLLIYILFIQLYYSLLFVFV